MGSAESNCRARRKYRDPVLQTESVALRRYEEAVDRRPAAVLITSEEGPIVSVVRGQFFPVGDNGGIAVDVPAVCHRVQVPRLQMVNVVTTAADRLDPGRNRLPVGPFFVVLRGRK